MLEVDGIHTYYGESHVLHGVSLRVAPGEAVALLGRNGAGKTTAIRSIVGFTPPRAGRVLFEGQAIERWPAYRIARRGLALVPQGRRIFAPLSVRENLLLGARSEGWTLERVFELFPRLRERQAQLGGTLSGGEQQMLAIARALLTNGRLLLLDEPSEGLAPLIVREIGTTLQALKAQRIALLLVEQNYHLALRVADRVYVMNKGQIV
ncbi:MAG TPA: ABC transporter ATP-binding protein, partial [Candidatus Eisenbacteria bacterium]|nr:ABC transporter ATP-binding protein [Candidatus Eisenbacteria bacterium]